MPRNRRSELTEAPAPAEVCKPRDPLTLTHPDNVRSVADVEREISRLKTLAHDPEAAHSFEDELRTLVLTAIAQGMWRDHPQAMATAVLKTKDVEFKR